MLKDKHTSLSEFPIEKYQGHEINKEFILKNGFQEPFKVISDCTTIGMKLPDKTSTLMDIANILGNNFPIKVIEVGQQQELDNWTIGDYAK